MTLSGIPGGLTATQVRLMVLPASRYMSGPPRISVTGSKKNNFSWRFDHIESSSHLTVK